MALLLLAVTRLYCFSSAGGGEGNLGFRQYPDRIAARVSVSCVGRDVLDFRHS